jgi:RND family efflux transporter MFP subunit
MKHQQPLTLDEEASNSTVAADAERSDNADPMKTYAPVKAGRAVILFGVAALAVAVSGVTSRRHDEKQLAHWTNEQAIPTVALVALREGAKATELVLPGNVEAWYNASIHGQVTGYVQDWRKDIGAKVHKGEILAVVDTPELDERIAEAESELTKAKANQALAHVTAQRWNSLRSTAAVSQQAADEKDSDANAKNAEVEAVAANVQRLKAMKAFDNIVAPFDGTVTQRNVDIGSLVKAESDNSAALFTVADIHQMRIYVRAPESYAAILKDGMKAALSLPEYPDRTFEATIDTTSHAIDMKSRSLLVELIADNKDGALAPGAFARVHFQIPPDSNAVTLPASALMFRAEGAEVATVGLDNRITLKKVQIARDLGPEVEITAGLGVSDRVVANPPDSISDGEEVRLVESSGGPPTAPGEQPSARLEGDHAKSVAQAERGGAGE